MKIAGILNACGDTDLVNDTLDSARKYLSEDLYMIVDGAHWTGWGSVCEVNVKEKINGFYHNYHKSPYKNVIFGLKTLYEKEPDAEWYCYFEPDVLFCNENFKEYLEEGSYRNAWCIGSDFRNTNVKLENIEKLFQNKFYITKYLLGCCYFVNKRYLMLLQSISFFDKFLYYTNSFEKGFFPGYNGYDLSEHLIPTLAHYLGGNVYGLSSWNGKEWLGKKDIFALRWKPEIKEEENIISSIMHPIKDFESPIRIKQREIRNG